MYKVYPFKRLYVEIEIFFVIGVAMIRSLMKILLQRVSILSLWKVRMNEYVSNTLDLHILQAQTFHKNEMCKEYQSILFIEKVFHSVGIHCYHTHSHTFYEFIFLSISFLIFTSHFCWLVVHYITPLIYRSLKIYTPILLPIVKRPKSSKVVNLINYWQLL